MLEIIANKILIRTFFTVAFIYGCIYSSSGQNLVPNPSFEDYNSLPFNFTQNKDDFNNSVLYWKMPTTGTTDIFTNLIDVSYSNHPRSTSNVAVGSQDPKDGEFMIGLIIKSVTPKYREYAQVELLERLKEEQVYFAGCYISLADNMQYASNNIGLLFTEDTIGSSNSNILLNFPQINSDQIIEEKNDWILFGNKFRASKPSKYLTIGNFYSEDNTLIKNVSDSVRVSSNNAYYFIDSVFVEPITDLEVPNVFTPNQDLQNQTFFIPGLQEDRWILTISNRWGQRVYRSIYYHNEWEADGLRAGVYYYYLKHRYVDLEYKGEVTILY